MWEFWLIAAGIFFIIEIFTTGFLIFWLGLASILAMITSFFTTSLIIQTTVFVIFSTIFMIFTRPLVNKFKRKRYKIITIIIGLIYLIFIIIFKNNIISSYLCFGLFDASLMIHPLVYRMFQLPYNNYKNYDVYYS